MAGSEFTLICIVEVVLGFTNMPSAVWLDADGATVVTGGDITVQTTPGNRETVTTLTFNPLMASDDGEFVCNADLITPAQPDTPLQVSVREVIQVQSKKLYSIPMILIFLIHMCIVSAPMVTLSLAPDPALVAGGVEDTTLICSAMVNQAVNRGTIIFTFTWRDRDGNPVVSQQRTAISPSTPPHSSTFPIPVITSTLTLSPLSTADTNFSCTVDLAESQNTLDPSEPVTMSIAVNVISESH